jgi:hypothetical protein
MVLGSGEVQYKTCTVCGGTGKVSIDRSCFTNYPDKSLEIARKLIKLHGRPIEICIVANHDIRVIFNDGSRYILGGFTVGYYGTGPDYTKIFLDIAGFNISIDEIAEMKPPVTLVTDTEKTQVNIDFTEFDEAKDTCRAYFVRDHSEAEVEQICAHYPLYTICSGLEKGDINQVGRFIGIMQFAAMLGNYEAFLESRPDLELPPDLDYKRLIGILIPRLIAFIDQLHDLPPLIAPTVSSETYTVGEQLVGTRPRDAIVFLQMSRRWSSYHRDHDFLILACYSNIAVREKDSSAINEGIKIAKDIIAREQGSLDDRDWVKDMLKQLEKLEAKKYK